MRSFHDANGNVEVQEDENHTRTRHFYDARDRLVVTVTDRDGDGAFEDRLTNALQGGRARDRRVRGCVSYLK